MKEITPDNYNDYLPLDIIAFSYAEPGAQGEAGAMILVTRDKTAFHLNYCSNNWSQEYLLEVCPMLNDVTITTFGYCDNAAEGWSPINLGAGNHLFVHNDYAQKLIEKIKEENVFPYSNWLRILQGFQIRGIDELIDVFLGKLLSKETHGEAMSGLQNLVKNGYEEMVHNKIESLISIHPNTFVLYDINAWLYRQVGRRDEALIFYAKSYELYPCKESLTEIFDCYFFTKRYTEALSLAEKIVEDYGNTHKMLVIKTKIKLLPPREALELIDCSLNDPDVAEIKFAESPLAEKAASICFEQGENIRAEYYIKRALLAPYPSRTAYELYERITEKCTN